MTDKILPYSPSSERNKQAIADVLQTLLPKTGFVLEIGSGTGQHIVYFAHCFPELHWQPSDRQRYLPGLSARIEVEANESVLPPLFLDVLETWPDRVFDVVYSANTSHIMDWAAVCAMFRGVAKHLTSEGLFCLYGPFNENGEFTAPSNEMFDAQLRRENPSMGLRELSDLESLAKTHQLKLLKKIPMPANNQILVFKKLSPE